AFGGISNLSVATPQSGGNLCGRGNANGNNGNTNNGNTNNGNGGGRGGRGGRGGGAGRGAQNDSAGGPAPGPAPAGLCTSAFAGGYTLSIMLSDIATPQSAKEVWHNQPNDREVTILSNIRWTGDYVVYQYTPQNDEFERYYSLKVTDPTARPVQLTTTNGLIEDATSVSFSPDGKTLYYCTNANDIEKRHIWSVPVSGGTPKQISTDDGIETYPQPLASGKQIAVLYFDAKTPASVGLFPTEGGKTKTIFPVLGAGFPSDAHVTPEIVITKAADGMEIHNQLFVPKDLKPGEKRPAMVFVHGGPVRQMLPGYHYMQFYHWAYAYNQWLQSQGYIVLSINYRGGVGYGRSFRTAPNTNSRGNSEYQDVLAGAKYLQGRADVDASRIGIWGLSYGGLLTSESLARNSDIFVAGADLAGVHLYTPTLDTANVAYKSSAVSAIDTWKSPVFLVHGDDDRNVDFAQTVGLVQLLRAHNVYYELMVIPDDLHESMLHSNWVTTFDRIGDFLHRFVWDKQTPPTSVTGSGK
ncbi:MAG TPA: prolyl oligopeptidase family serine peptidase, partial [Gemmatimonadaceae bacterium]|nr:prolyl oligopeptidase family serine peptidase [Gemmatimonadaceae bacterium]